MTVTDTMRVLIVDDSADLRLLARIALEGGGLDVVAEGTSGEDAIALAGLHQPDVVLLDVSMPGMDGLAALPRLREIAPESCVVMYSGFDAQGLALKALELGAVAYVEKGSPIDDLAQRIRDAVSGVVSAQESPLQARIDEHIERFRLVFDTSPIGMVTITLSGTIVRANGAAAALTGRSCEQLIGMSCTDIVVPEERAAVVAAVYQSVTQQAPLTFEHEISRPDGTRRMARTNMATVIDRAGQPLYLFAQCEDVTERRHADAALRASEARYRLLAENSTDLVVRCDPESVVLWASPASRLVIGYEPEELIGRCVLDFFELESMQQVDVPGASGGDLLTVTSRAQHKDGHWIWLESTVRYLTDPETGALLETQSSSRDVTIRHTTEARLQQALNSMLDAVSVLSAVRDEDGHVVDFRFEFMNDPAVRLGGRPASAYVGRTVFELYPALAGSEIHAAYHSVLETGEPAVVEAFPMRGHQGLRIYDANVTRLNDGCLVAFRDVTDARRDASDLAAANDELILRATALERSNCDLEQFAGAISHDLRSPLLVAQGFVDVHRGTCPATSDGDGLSRASAQLARLRTMIDDLLTWSRVELQPAFEVVDLDVILADVRTDLGLDVARASLTVFPLPAVHGSATLVYRLFANLVSNAVKFVAPGATPNITVSGRREHGWSVFTVADNGIGIAANDRDRAFELFQRLRPDDGVSGTGVGLAICKRIVEHHGGRIWIEDGPHGGSRFCFTLPAAG